MVLRIFLSLYEFLHLLDYPTDRWMTSPIVSTSTSLICISYYDTLGSKHRPNTHYHFIILGTLLSSSLHRTILSHCTQNTTSNNRTQTMIKVLAVAIASLSALVGFADAANVHPNNVLLKQDGGTAAAGIGAATRPDYPWRMLRKGLKDNMVKGGGKVPKHEDSPQDVGAQIVGGEEVNPPRKYKVRTQGHVRTLSTTPQFLSTKNCALIVNC
jgi:hypothetical protein